MAIPGLNEIAGLLTDLFVQPLTFAADAIVSDNQNNFLFQEIPLVTVLPNMTGKSAKRSRQSVS